MELMIQHLGKGMGLMLILSLPCVLTAAAVGLIVGILQAVTQVQEQTIAAAPKILMVFLIIMLGGGIFMTMMSDYVRESFHIAFNEIPMYGPRILPPREVDPGKLRAKKFFKAQLEEGQGGAMRSLAKQGAPSAVKGDPQGPSLFKMGTPPAGSALGPAERLSLDGRR
jgi:flagellar biosynthesis protein FliQ